MVDMNKEEIQGLFSKYDSVDSEVEAAKKVLDEKLSARSECVKAIMGTGLKRFTIKGQKVTVVTSKTGICFFRGKKNQEDDTYYKVD